jgi:hypothetical protein
MLWPQARDHACAYGASDRSAENVGTLDSYAVSYWVCQHRSTGTRLYTTTNSVRLRFQGKHELRPY